MLVEAEFILNKKCDQNTNGQTYRKSDNINCRVEPVLNKDPPCDFKIGREHRHRFNLVVSNDKFQLYNTNDVAEQLAIGKRSSTFIESTLVKFQKITLQVGPAIRAKP